MNKNIFDGSSRLRLTKSLFVENNGFLDFVADELFFVYLLR